MSRLDFPDGIFSPFNLFVASSSSPFNNSSCCSSGGGAVLFPPEVLEDIRLRMNQSRRNVWVTQAKRRERGVHLTRKELCAMRKQKKKMINGGCGFVAAILMLLEQKPKKEKNKSPKDKK
jgi:hypothetical protein